MACINFVAGTQLNSTETTGSFRFDVSRSRTQTIKFAYNGTHICSSAQLRLETDTCWAGSSPGCYNKTNACDSMCFLSTDYYKRHRLRLFRSYKSSYDIGTWEENDYAALYTMPAKQITCYHGNESYTNWDYSDSIVSYPNLQKMVCPVGQRCRISTGKVMYSDPITTYVGCERDENQYDGCEGGCSILEYHRSPGGGSSRWVELCKYCCTESLCNDPYKCKGTKCDLHTEPSGAANSFFKTYYRFINAVCFLVALQLLVAN